jgi:predicted TIM-barrel fold metal-dependent hydrolase
VSELIGEYENLPLKDAVRRKWLYDNAARVFGAA